MMAECTQRALRSGRRPFPGAGSVNYFDGSTHHDAWRRAVIPDRSLPALRTAAVVALTLATLSLADSVGAQRPRPPTGPLHPYTSVAGPVMPAATFDSTAFGALHWRELGPFRGGRSVAVAGNPSRPNEFWMGTTGG